MIKNFFALFVFILLMTSYGEGSAMKPGSFFSKDVSSLVKALDKTDENRARQLVEKGIPINVRGKEGITPLFWLLMEQNKDGMQLALELGADPNLSDLSGDTPVALAAGAKDEDYLKILLEAGGNPDSLDRNGEPAIFNAINEDRFEQIGMLQRHGANLNLTNPMGENSALHAAALAKYDIVYFLLEQGVDYTAKSNVDDYLAWTLHDQLSNELIAPTSSAYEWAMKTKLKLLENGVSFPPPSPSEIRWAEGRPNMFDIEARKREKTEKD